MAASVNLNEDASKMWHMRLGHTSEKSMQSLAKEGLLKSAKTCKLKFCKHCILSKKVKVKFDNAIHRTKEILDYVHIDV